MSTGRLEAFSDGVIAVAATLLVLNITVPTVSSHTSLIHALLAQWPKYAAYVVSFATIGIIWINHHATISRLREADRTILILNLVLLITIVVLPFTTSLMATYLNRGTHANLAAAIYAGALLVMSLAFASLSQHILTRKAHLLAESLTPERRHQIGVWMTLGFTPYALAAALAVLSPYATLAICAGVAVFYASPLGSGG